MHNRDDVLFGEERIRESIREAVRAGGGPEQVVETIRKAVEAHADGLPPRDDVTIVLAQSLDLHRVCRARMK